MLDLLLTIQSVADFVDAVQELPIGIHLIAAAAVVSGVLFWWKGSRIARPAFITLGAIGGAAAGFFFLPMTGWEGTEGLSSPHIGLAGGLVMGGVAAVALYRFAVASSSAAVLALACTLGVAAALGPVEPAAPDGGLTTEEHMLEGVPVENTRAKAPPKAPPAEASKGVEDEDAQTPGATARTIAFLNDLQEELQALWFQLPAAHRIALLLTAIAGGAGGFVAGSLKPNQTVAIVSSLVGAAVWIPGVIWLGMAAGLPGLTKVEEPDALAWLMIWILLSGIGMTLQFTAYQKRKRRERDDEDDDDDV